jgi:hypothetical protein
MTVGRRPHGYWVIFAGAVPTSFRARTRDVLLPTLHQLQRTQPDVTLKWFERGRVWSSPLEAKEAALAARSRPRQPKRPRDWRPGGEHRDPRQRFELTRDQKRARFKARSRRGPGPNGGRPAPHGRPRPPRKKGPR